MSPVDDTFLSASLDSTVRLWDLRTNACQGLIRRTGRASVAYDAQGLIFAVATSNNAVKLYDLRSFEKVRVCRVCRVSCVCGGACACAVCVCVVSWLTPWSLASTGSVCHVLRGSSHRAPMVRYQVQ
jgi:WD40 repeat protein